MSAAATPDQTVASASATALHDRPSPADARRDQVTLLLRAAFAYLVLFVALTKAFSKYAEEIPFGGSPWSAGEWLVNYGGGFVRRGLFGELWLHLVPGGMTGVWALYVMQMSLLMLLVAYGVHALHRARYSWGSIALVCGPASIPFMGWGDSSFHKEILPFVVMALLAWARGRSRRPFSIVVLVVVAFAVFVLAVLSWEASALMLPAVLYLLVAPGAPQPRLTVLRRSFAALFVVIGGVVAVVSTLVHGNAETAAAVCRSVREHGYAGVEICGAVGVSGGGIEAIGWSSYKTTMDLAIAFPTYAGFGVLIALALVPAVLSRWFRTNWGWALLIVIGLAPLYVVVTDYGRWTFMIVISLMICITADDATAADSPQWNWIAGIAYVSLWGMPHWVTPGIGDWPFLGFGSTMLDYLVSTASVVLPPVPVPTEPPA